MEPRELKVGEVVQLNPETTRDIKGHQEDAEGENNGQIT